MLLHLPQETEYAFCAPLELTIDRNFEQVDSPELGSSMNVLGMQKTQRSLLSRTSAYPGIDRGVREMSVFHLVGLHCTRSRLRNRVRSRNRVPGFIR